MATLLVVSDIHYAGAAEQARRGFESRSIGNPLLRLVASLYRHFVWLRDPFAHQSRFDAFLAEAGSPDIVVANGDYSCDTGFIGVGDNAAFESASECLQRLRDRFGPRFHAIMGDHELGKLSLFGGVGGLRLASWRNATQGLGLVPFWKLSLGHYVLMGVTSTLVALPVYYPEMLADEVAAWEQLRTEHLIHIREGFAQLEKDQRVLLFCHDPTALPFLWREDVVRQRIQQIEHTIIGHLHSQLVLWKSGLLTGLPHIRFAGNSIRRYSAALREARHWRSFKVKLCPSLTGIQLLKDGGYLRLELDLMGRHPPQFHLCSLSW